MQAERDHLRNIVFPKVEEELRKKRIRLETVDLRWGVDTASVNEDEREATILKVCIEEIERCKPFFIGLLGDRYGWVPPEERITNATAGRKLLLPNKGKSVTALEIEFGVLASSEQLNRSVFYLREPLPYDKLSREKAAKFSDEHDPDLSEEEKRIRKEALNNLKKAIKTHFESINLQDKAKPYSTDWSNDLKSVVCGLESWGDTVVKDILSECEKHAEDTWGEAPKDQHEQELSLMEAFIEEHTHISTTITEKGEEQIHTFCGRKNLIRELREHLLSSDKDNRGLVLTGESGSGKSAVFSMMYKIMIKEDCFVLAHSAGISPGAKSVMALLQKWNRQLSGLLGISEEKERQEQEQEKEIRGTEEQRLYSGDIEKSAPKTGIEKMQERFVELVYQASESKRVVLLIDAFDRFESTSRAQYMTWLPDSLSFNIRVLITAITGTEKNAVQYNKGLVTRSIDHFTDEEAREMLHSLGRKQHKSLPPAVGKEILEKLREDGFKACSSPLWLSLAVNILIVMDADDFEKMSGLKGKGDEQIKSYMLEIVKQFPALPGDLFLDLIKRAARIFGESFTVSLFDFIACSRNGLRESDLELLLPKQTAQAWDPLLFAGLRRWFRVHLVEQGEGHQWNLGHSILRNTLKGKMEPDNFKKMHILISSHLLTLPVIDTLRTTEAMYHLLQPEDKIPAIEYYTSELGNESLAGATNILSETVTSGEEGLATVAFFPSLIEDRKDFLPGLLGRFIYTLNDDLAQEGNLERRFLILNNLKKVIEKRFGSQNPTWGFGYNKAGLYEKLGSIHQAMGHMEEARKYFEEELILSKELYESNPRNESMKNGIAISYEKLGDIHKSMGHMEEALKYFEKDLELTKELYESNPRNESLKNGLAVSYEKLGDIHQSMGHMGRALKYFENYNQLEKELYESNPRNESLKHGLAISYEKLGDIHQSMGQMEEALKYFEKRSLIGKELYESNPRKESLKNGLAISYSKLGDINMEIGQTEEALRCFEKRSELAKELYEVNPNNESLKSGLAISYERLGSIFQLMGHMEKALNYFEKDHRLIQELYEANQLSESLKNGLAISYSKLGEIHKAMGHMEDALKYFEKFNHLSNELCEANHLSESLKNVHAISYEKLGDIHQAMGHMEEALKYFEKNLEIMKDLYNANPLSESVKSGLAISYSELGDIHMEIGHAEEALRCFEKGSELAKELYEVNPNNESLKSGLASSYERLGSIFQVMGQIGKALNYFEKDHGLRQELLKANQLSESLKSDLAISHERLGNIHYAMGRMEDAFKNFEKRLTIGRELCEANPHNVNLLEGFGISYYKLAMMCQEMGNNDKGKEYFSRWKNIISFLSKNLPQVAKYREWNEIEY